MNIVRRMTLGLIAVFLLTSATTASADQGKTTDKQHTHDTISFSMKPGPEGCPNLQAALEGTGASDSWIKTTTFANGSRQVVDDREVNGTVVDPSGKRRTFQYLNHTILSQSADGALVIVEMTDSFVVKEKGRQNLLESRFHWLWTYNPADPSAAPSVENTPWPPVDNWVQLETGGDPLHCDPI